MRCLDGIIDSMDMSLSELRELVMACCNSWGCKESDMTERLNRTELNLCKQNYLYGNLPFYKIQVNHFMSQDESSGAKIIPKCILWMRDLVPF